VDEDRKRALRAAVLAARRDLTDQQRTAASSAIVGRLQRMPELRTARTVLLYAATKGEVDLGELASALAAREVRTLFPRVGADDELELVAAEVGMLRPGYRGIQEPAGVRIDPAVVDVALIPGVAFDLAGGRLGRGGGHYDRLLARLPDQALRIGVAFACQVVPRVPRDDHDAVVDLVVTERTTYNTGAREHPTPG
jgi:5-formyltetrahydrofolate cyclo-ligase